MRSEGSLGFEALGLKPDSFEKVRCVCVWLCVEMNRSFLEFTLLVYLTTARRVSAAPLPPSSRNYRLRADRGSGGGSHLARRYNLWSDHAIVDCDWYDRSTCGIIVHGAY